MGKEMDSYTPEEREFNKYVVSSLLYFNEATDVTKFLKEYKWSHDKIFHAFWDVIYNNPQIFYVDYHHLRLTNFRVVGKSNIICGLTDYKFSIKESEYPQRKAELDKVVAEAMEYASGSDDPVEKARRLHDFIVRICEYDKKAAEEDDYSPLARTAYSALVRRKAVCEGYMMGYRYLLREAGIYSEEVFSDAMGHCWNYVKIGDNWYHVDVTWDDPIFSGKNPETFPALHDHFLLSDKAIRAMGYYGWDVNGLPAATDTRYDWRYWGSPFDLIYLINFISTSVKKSYAYLKAWLKEKRENRL